MASTQLSGPLRTLARHQEVLVGILAAFLFSLGRLQGLAVPEALGGAALCVPLGWGRRRPSAAFTTVAGASLLFLALVGDSTIFVLPLSFAAYLAAVRGRRGPTALIGAAVVAYAAAVAVIFSPDNGSVAAQTLELTVQIGFALAVGEAVRSQRAFVAATRDRAEHAVREHELEARRRMGQERIRIARDVHDVVAHSLATISTQASVGVHVGREEPERAVAVLQAINEVSTGALQDLRQALGVLRDDGADAPTAPVPSLRELPDLVDRARGAGLSVVLRVEGATARLPGAVQLAIYRIVQEGLTNVMRHAEGASVLVRVAVGDRRAEVEVSDDGAGVPSATSQDGAGAGLLGMHERASSLGGAFETGRTERGGFRVRAVFPTDERPE